MKNQFDLKSLKIKSELFCDEIFAYQKNQNFEQQLKLDNKLNFEQQLKLDNKLNFEQQLKFGNKLNFEQQLKFGNKFNFQKSKSFEQFKFNNNINLKKDENIEKQSLKRVKIKHFCILLLIAFLAGFCFVFANFSVQKNNFNTSFSIENDLQNTTDEQLGYFDFSGLDDELKNLENIDNFGASSFFEKVKALISGEYSFSFSDLFSSIFSTFIVDLKKLVPLLTSIFALAILSNIVGHFKTKTSKNLSNIIHFVCYSAVIIIVCSAVTSLVNITTSVINSMQNQMEVIFPIILTLMASVGNTVSVGIYQPIMAMLSGLIINVFSYVILPIFLISFVISVVGNLSNNIKLNKFSSLLNNIFKWVIGAVFTVFTGVMAVKGISAGSFDSVSIRTTKYALKTYIPLVGGYLSDGFNLIMASSVLIKNAVGTAGLLLIFLSILSPVITILVFKWALHLLSAVLEPLMDDKISNFLFSVSKAINMLIASILCVALMYLISVGLLMTSGNVYWG